MKERIQKTLARANVASRRRVEAMILEGRIRLNGKRVNELGVLMDPSCDVIHVNGQLIGIAPEYEQEKLYVLLNKPPQVVTTLKDNTVLTEIFPPTYLSPRGFFARVQRSCCLVDPAVKPRYDTVQ